MFKRGCQGILARFYATLILAALVCWVADVLATRRDVSVAGGCSETTNPALMRGRGRISRAISYCQAGDTEKLTLRTGEFPRGTARVDLEVSGYPGTDGVGLMLVARDGQQFVEELTPAGDHWMPVTVLVPQAFRRTPFRIQLVDDSSANRAWGGLAVVRYSRLQLNGGVMACVLAGLALLHFLMLEFVALTGRLRAPREAVLVGMTGLGLLSYAAFWAYYLSHSLGIILSGAVALLLLGHASWRLLRRRTEVDTHIQELHRFMAPATLATLLLSVIALYPFPSAWDTWQYAASRWINLPIDNWLPKIFADQVWSGSIARPMIGDWLSSDRPPLQAGFALLLGLPAYKDGWYQIASTWLQMTFLVPVAYLLPLLGLQKVRGIALVLFATSALALYNGAFAWPKLIAATYCLIFYIAAASTARTHLTSHLRTLLMGGGAALAMLTHGGTLFALVGIACVAIAGKVERKWATLVGAGILAVATYAPWMIYQHYIDPPGTRLLAWHLAGVEQVTPEPVGAVIRHAYDQLTLRQWASGRWTNIRTLFADGLNFYSHVLEALTGWGQADAATTLRSASFRHFFYSLWFFTPLLWLLLLRRGRRWPPPVSREVTRQMMAIVIGLGCWSLLIFTPGQTINHQGSYSLNIMAMLVSMAAAMNIGKWAFQLLALLNLLIFALVFVAAPHASPQDFQTILQPVLSADRIYLLLCLACFLGLYAASGAAEGLGWQGRGGALGGASFEP